jgi:hypothetical protein
MSHRKEQKRFKRLAINSYENEDELQIGRNKEQLINRFWTSTEDISARLGFEIAPDCESLLTKFIAAGVNRMTAMVSTLRKPSSGRRRRDYSKASQGANIHDSKYHDRRERAKELGFLSRAHPLDWGSVSDQVENFLAYVRPEDDELISLDWEPSDGLDMTLDQGKALRANGQGGGGPLAGGFWRPPSARVDRSQR